MAAPPLFTCVGELPRGTGIPFRLQPDHGSAVRPCQPLRPHGCRRPRFGERRRGGDLVATSLAEVITEQLESLGYRLLACPSGEVALTTAQAYRGAIDLRVTDVVMPRTNGRERARRPREALSA